MNYEESELKRSSLYLFFAFSFLYRHKFGMSEPNEIAPMFELEDENDPHHREGEEVTRAPSWISWPDSTYICVTITIITNSTKLSGA